MAKESMTGEIQDACQAVARSAPLRFQLVAHARTYGAARNPTPLRDAWRSAARRRQAADFVLEQDVHDLFVSMPSRA